jgi:preprotein translocase subunit YajC
MEFWSLVQVLAKGGEKQPAADNNLLMFAPLILIAIVFYLLLWKPQRREQAARDKMLSELKQHDRVATIGGIIGTVANISSDGQEVTLKVDDNTRIKFVRSSIQRVLSTEGEAGRPAEAK